MKYALISVSNKNHIVDFASRLIELGYTILSTGGTKNKLLNNGVACISIEKYTDFNEILDGRVKTLHPKIHGGILSIRDNENHKKELEDNDINFIDLVVVNLYPFKETISNRDSSYNDAIENIDIGGPSMLRSAAKNHKYVSVVCDSSDYDLIINEIKDTGDTSIGTRKYLAAKAFRHTAKYDAIIADYLSNDDFHESYTVTYDLYKVLRYGENPHQQAAVYKNDFDSYSVVHSKQLHGKKLSFNNFQDANAALDILKEFNEPTVVALKHMNPCGVGSSENLYGAWNKAYKSDETSIFGGIVAFNKEVTYDIAIELSKIFLEIVIAPSFSIDALELLKKKKNIRLLEYINKSNNPDKKITSINGGLLVQDSDNELFSDLEVVTEKVPTEDELSDLLFALKGVKHVKSNAILLAKDKMTVGIGVGQTSRIKALEIALNDAKIKGVENMVLASDAFFPFDDVVKLAAKYGVTAIIQPGGSIRDNDSISACNELGISMIMTSMRHFKH